MANKTLGYSLSIIGLIVLVLSYPVIRTAIKLPASFGIKDSILMVIGLVIIVLGVVLAFNKSSSSGKQEEEVPIYEGEGKHRRIVGYRKMNKK